MTNPAFPRHPPRCSALRHPTRNRGAAARLRTRRNRPVPGCRGRACPVPFLQLARLQDGRPQGSPLQGPVSNSCTVPGRSCRGRCPVPFLQLARLQDGRPQGSPLQGPVQLARLQDGRPQGSPLQGPVSNSCTVPGRSCRGRACPVPFLQLARLQDGRPVPAHTARCRWRRYALPQRHRPRRREVPRMRLVSRTRSPLSSSWVRVHSRSSCSLHDSRTGDHKGRPYKVPCRIHARCRDGLVGDGLVPSRSCSLHDSGTGDHKGRPYNRETGTPTKAEMGTHALGVLHAARPSSHNRRLRAFRGDAPTRQPCGAASRCSSANSRRKRNRSGS